MADGPSEARRAANRGNAQHSTGPRLPTGKARSRTNALKHGLLAREVLILEGDGAEAREDFDALLADFVAELQPEGLVEETLVERIATTVWRLRRAQRYEVGCLRASLDTAPADGPEPAPGSAADVRARIAAATARLEKLTVDRAWLDGKLDLTDRATFLYLLPDLTDFAAAHALPPYVPPFPPTLQEMLDSMNAEGDATVTLGRDEWLARLYFLITVYSTGISEEHLWARLRAYRDDDLAQCRAELEELQAELPRAERADRLRAARQTLTGSLPGEGELQRLGAAPLRDHARPAVLSRPARTPPPAGGTRHEARGRRQEGSATR